MAFRKAARPAATLTQQGDDLGVKAGGCSAGVTAVLADSLKLPLFVITATFGRTLAALTAEIWLQQTPVRSVLLVARTSLTQTAHISRPSIRRGAKDGRPNFALTAPLGLGSPMAGGDSFKCVGCKKNLVNKNFSKVRLKAPCCCHAVNAPSTPCTDSDRRHQMACRRARTVL